MLNKLHTYLFIAVYFGLYCLLLISYVLYNKSISISLSLMTTMCDISESNIYDCSFIHGLDEGVNRLHLKDDELYDPTSTAFVNECDKLNLSCSRLFFDACFYHEISSAGQKACDFLNEECGDLSDAMLFNED